jgi:hypothetical protein
MRTLFASLLAALALAVSTAVPAASFNYHGTLQDGGRPAEGSYDLQLTLYSAPRGGQVIGGPLIVYKVPVHDGAFSTDVDFGPVQNTAGGSWLAVQVRKSGDAQFAALDARAAVSVNDAEATGSVCPGAWTIAGNAGNPAGSYLGTADNNPLVFEVNGLRAGSLTPNTSQSDSPNVVFGSSSNNARTAYSATVSGGYYNTASGNDSTVSGGSSNTASGGSSTVSGGSSNTATGHLATVSGGIGNTASGESSTVSGGYYNTAAAAGSFAAGGYTNVRSSDTGTFVWSDSTASYTSPFTSTGPNQFLINATGGVGIGTNNPNGNQLRVMGTNAAGVAYVENDNTGVGASALHAYNAKGYGFVGEGGNVAIYSHNTGSAGNSVYLSTSSLAGDFYGNVRVTGDLSVSGSVTKGGGAFKIDDPLDPANKVLSHSFVESPDMKNVYDGVATLDANGTAWVELPEYFEALNQDFRYQLTALDAPAPSLYIAQRISNNRFRIAGGAPNQQVSWQVTGTRHDAWAKAHRIPVEENKPSDERGRYLAPEAFGLPASLAIGQANPPTKRISSNGAQP